MLTQEEKDNLKNLALYKAALRESVYVSEADRNELIGLIASQKRLTDHIEIEMLNGAELQWLAYLNSLSYDRLVRGYMGL